VTILFRRNLAFQLHVQKPNQPDNFRGWAANRRTTGRKQEEEARESGCSVLQGREWSRTSVRFVAATKAFEREIAVSHRNVDS
jgi:hypothetical protein